jgi:hypothetical protein
VEEVRLEADLDRGRGLGDGALDRKPATLFTDVDVVEEMQKIDGAVTRSLVGDRYVPHGVAR